MTYPLPSNITGLWSFVTYVNLVTNNHFGWIMLFSISTVMFLSLMEVTTPRKALLSVSLLNSVLSALFFFSNFVNVMVFSLGMILMFGMVAYYFLNKEAF